MLSAVALLMVHLQLDSHWQSDWEAISAVVGTLVFVATLVLAWSSWEMAKAATVQADTAVKLLDASATAIPRVVRTASNPVAPWAA